jgi:hypothetical protein
VSGGILFAHRRRYVAHPQRSCARYKLASHSPDLILPLSTAASVAYLERNILWDTRYGNHFMQASLIRALCMSANEMWEVCNWSHNWPGGRGECVYSWTPVLSPKSVRPSGFNVIKNRECRTSNTTTNPRRVPFAAGRRMTGWKEAMRPLWLFFST